MADLAKVHRRNAAGPWFVDTTCIDCGACRDHAPEIFGDAADAAFVSRQPENPDEVRRSWLALLACPMGSIGAGKVPRPQEAAFPLAIAPDVFLCGYTSRHTYGANAYFLRRPGGNLLVDVPRLVPALLLWMARAGGVSDVLLTHQDDVAGAEEIQRAFGARVWIHAADAAAAPSATDRIEGAAAREIRPGVTAVPVPGHTRGSVVYLVDGTFAFTGDSLAWRRDDAEGREQAARQPSSSGHPVTPTKEGHLVAFRDACWHSWEAQADSLARLAAFPFQWVLPGHGHRTLAAVPALHTRLPALVARMRG